MTEQRNPHVAWLVGGETLDGGVRRKGRRGRARAAPVTDAHAQRRQRQWEVLDTGEGREEESTHTSSSRGEEHPTWAVTGRRWQTVSDGAAVRKVVQDPDRIHGLRWIAFLFLLAIPVGVASFVASLAIVIGHNWPYYVLAGVIILFTLIIGSGLAIMVRTPWAGSELERHIVAAGETPLVIFPIRRPFNRGWGAASGEALWFWNRVHRFLWKRPPTRIHFSSVRGYRAIQRGSRTTLLLLVYLVRRAPQVPSMTWGIHRGQRLDLLSLDLTREEAENVIGALVQYGVRPQPALQWSSFWGAPLNRRTVLSTLAGAVVAEGLVLWALPDVSPIEVVVVSLPLVALVASGARRVVHGQKTGVILLAAGMGALLSTVKLYHTEAMAWRVLLLVSMSLAGIVMIRDARRGVVGWIPNLFRLLWTLWLLLGLALIVFPG